MLSHHKFVGLLSVLAVSLAIAAFIVYQQAHTCTYTDKAYCRFLSTLKPQTFAQTHGTYTTQQGEKASKVLWTLVDDHKQIQVMVDNKETMNMIVMKDRVYIKDYRDGFWWMQSKREMETHIVDLQFDPEIFLMASIDRFKRSEAKIQQSDEVSCGDKSCLRYTLEAEQEAKQEYIDIDAKTANLVRYAGQNGDIVSAFSVQYEKKRIDIPTHIKEAAPGQNIFLEQFMANPVEQSAEDLEFVRDFEREMKERGVETE